MRRPNSRDPIVPGQHHPFRFSDVKLDSETDDHSDSANNDLPQVKTTAPPVQPGQPAEGRGAGGFQSRTPFFKAPPPSPPEPEVKPEQKPAEAAQGGYWSSWWSKPAEKPAEPAPKPELQGATFGASTISAGRPMGGIQGERKPADLENIGHSMKSEGTRIQEAQSKYAQPSAPSSSYAETMSKFSYANPPPPALRPEDPALHQHQQRDLEAQKPSKDDEEGGSSKKGTIISIILIILILAAIAGGVTAFLILNKPKKK